MIDLDLKPSSKKLREFAIIALFGFGFIGLCLFKGWLIFPQNVTAAYVMWGLAVITPILGMIFPKAILPIYLLLTIVAFPIGFIVSFLVLILMFFFLFTPFALFFKLVGRDALDRKLDPDAKTYWKDVEQRPSEDYLRPF